MAEEDLTFDVPVMSVPHGQQQSQACNCTDICHSETGNCALNKCIFFQNLLFHGPKYPVKMTRDSNCTHDVLVKKKKKSGMNILPLYSVDTHRDLIFID